jgi:K(+)-stimulated pyrophosphate-energized sodium pump
VGDPFKDTSSVALNPVIKFTTLFGLLAMEIAVTMKNADLKAGIGALFLMIALLFVYRSFYTMRIPEAETSAEARASVPQEANSVSALAK